MKLVLFFLCLQACFYDNDTIKQVIFNDDKKISVSIEGHINKPGTYLLKDKATTNDLIEVAKGYKEDALILDDILLKDFDYFFVNSNRIDDKINLNDDNLSLEELTSIKGIGPSIANKILDYKKQQAFTSVSDLKNIKGIKDKLFNKIYEYFSV